MLNGKDPKTGEGLSDEVIRDNASSLDQTNNVYVELKPSDSHSFSPSSLLVSRAFNIIATGFNAFHLDRLGHETSSCKSHSR